MNEMSHINTTHTIEQKTSINKEELLYLLVDGIWLDDCSWLTNRRSFNFIQLSFITEGKKSGSITLDWLSEKSKQIDGGKVSKALN